jgi:hypothetical protein
MIHSPDTPADLVVSQQARGSSRAMTLILLATSVTQLALLFFSMPLTKLLSGEHSYYIDNPYHVYQLELGKALLQQGQLLGFDPFLGAGHLGGMNDNVSARVPVFLAALLPASMPSGAVYSIYILVCSLLGPLSVVWMARLLKWPLLCAATASAIGLALWWIGALHWYHSAGMASFVCGCYLGLPYAVWTWKLSIRKELKIASLAGAGLLGGLGMWLHPLFPVLVAALFSGFFIADFPRAPVRNILARGIFIAAIALVVNAPWVIAMLGSHDVGANPLLAHPFQKTVGLSVAWKPALGLWRADSMGTILNPLMFLVCGVGLFFMRATQRRAVVPFVFAGIALLLFAAFGAVSTSLGALQPNRFIAPAFLLVALGAAYCVGTYVESLRMAGGRAQVLVAVGAAFLLALWTAREVIREASAGPHGHYGKSPPELSEAPALVAQLEAWIAANTSADGRIVFETSLARIHGGGHVAGLIALHTGRELVGAAYPYSLPDLSLWDHFAFGKPIREVSSAELAERFELNNAGWVIAHSPELKKAMESLKSSSKVAQFGAVWIYKIERPLSYIYAGRGQIASRGFNRLEVTGSGGLQVVLKYHWLPGLVTSPPARIEPVQVHPGVPPFICVLNPPPDFTVSLCPKCGAHP